jgi:small conductance mechanosensitive channel
MPNFTFTPAMQAVVLSDALNFIAALLILVLGWMLANAVSRWVQRALQHVLFLDPLLKPLIRSFLRYAVLLLTIIAVLQRFGVQTTSLIAVFGAAGLAVGLALQGTLSNVAAGVMLLLLRPFHIGETIEIYGTAGTLGTVREVGLFRTVVVTRDNIQLSIPNSSIFSAIIANHSREPLRRIDIHVSIDRINDIGKAEEIVVEALSSNPLVVKEPAPTSGVQSVEEYAVVLLARCWVNNTDQFRAPFMLRKIVQDRLQAGGVSIPVTRQAPATRTEDADRPSVAK